MHRILIMNVALLLSSIPTSSQKGIPDSPTLQALLAEVRQLRQDLQSSTTAAQKAQILLFRLQTQERAVELGLQRIDDARAKLAVTQSEREKLVADIKQAENFVSDTENAPADRKQLEGVLPQLKAKLESLETEEQQRQRRETEAVDQLRADRAKLGELQDRLDRLEKSLEGLIQHSSYNRR